MNAEYVKKKRKKGRLNKKCFLPQTGCKNLQDGHYGLLVKARKINLPLTVTERIPSCDLGSPTLVTASLISFQAFSSPASMSTSCFDRKQKQETKALDKKNRVDSEYVRTYHNDEQRVIKDYTGTKSVGPVYQNIFPQIISGMNNGIHCWPVFVSPLYLVSMNFLMNEITHWNVQG